MIIRLIKFHDNLNIEVTLILAPGRKFLSGKCVQLPWHFSLVTILINF